jgi:hypothetical protein
MEISFILQGTHYTPKKEPRSDFHMPLRKKFRLISNFLERRKKKIIPLEKKPSKIEEEEIIPLVGPGSERVYRRKKIPRRDDGLSG